METEAICTICPHNCKIKENALGFCSARRNVAGKIIGDSYGKLTSIALDPIEKKPLNRFYPGSKILSVGSYGCNFRCSFCQNHSISMKAAKEVETALVTPEQLVEKAISLKEKGNIGIAFTYNEPLISYEFVFDTAKAAHEAGLKNVLVTNGYIIEEPLNHLLPYIDAMNIDLKAFSKDFYQKIKGDLGTVMKTIQAAAKQCHVEVTTLIIPQNSDSPEEIEKLSQWLSTISPEIPLHLSRFFPRYLMEDIEPTPKRTLFELADIARKHLKYVYVGNI